MTIPVFIVLGLAVFTSSVSIDFAGTRYVQAVRDDRRLRAATWSVLQWCAATVGFVVAVKVSLWLLPLEAAGLFVGTLLAVRKVGD